MSRRHVVPMPNGGWAVRTPGRSPITKHRTQQAAENAAKQAVKTEGGGEVVIHRRNGQIRDSDTVAPGRDPNPPQDAKH